MADERFIKAAYWPEFYKDELLYSAIARFGRHTQMPSAQKINAYLFDYDGAEAVYDLPKRIERLAMRLPLQRGCTPYYILKEHTLYNFYAAFVNQSEREDLASSMISSTARGPGSSISRRSAVGAVNRLRFCPNCRDEMIEEHGEAYWMRMHQVPTVLVCAKHQRLLQASSILAGTGCREYTPLTIHTESNDINLLSNNISKVTFDKFIRLAQISENIMKEGLPSNPAEQNLHYRSVLHSKGFTSSTKKHVRNYSLEKEAEKYSEDIITTWPDLMRHGSRAEKWFRLPTRLLDYKVHPAHHVLFEDFIQQLSFIDPSNVSRKSLKDLDFDPLCYNPLAEHTCKPSVKFLGHRKCVNGTRLRFICECGYEYNIVKKPDGTYGRHNCVNFGPTLTPYLDRAERECWSVKKLSRMTGVSREVLTTQAKKLGRPFKTQRAWRGKANLEV